MNIFDLPQLPLNEELTTILVENANVRIERIISAYRQEGRRLEEPFSQSKNTEQGQVSDWYDQAETEFVILLEGSAKIEYDNNETFALTKGDTLLIKPHKKHRVCYTSNEQPCVWLCVFF